MIWLLLLLYPLVGAGIWIDLGRKYKNIKYYSDWVDSVDLLFLGLIWPVLVWGHYRHLNGRLDELAEERERGHERLIERIRKEPDPLLADWDREFNELAGIEEVVPEYWLGPEKLTVPVMYYRNYGTPVIPKNYLFHL